MVIQTEDGPFSTTLKKAETRVYFSKVQKTETEIYFIRVFGVSPRKFW
jgi:hypothetical protein